MQTRSFSTTAGPDRIFIVRHGDRIDHEMPSWRRTAPRPHDSPLSAKGHISAHLLGRFLARERGLGVTEESLRRGDVVFLASPLQRTVETAHDIILGMMVESGLKGVALARMGINSGGADAPTSETTTAAIGAAAAAPSIADSNARYLKACETVEQIYAEFTQKGIPLSSSASSASFTSITADADANNGGADGSSGMLSSSSVVASPSAGGGGVSGAADSDAPLPMIFLEPGVIEGEYWLNRDISSGVELGNTCIRIDAVKSTELNSKSANDVAVAAAVSDDGVFRGADFHRSHVSTLVSPTSLTCPVLSSPASLSNSAAAAAPANATQQQQQGSAVGIVPNGFAFLEMGYDESRSCIVEKGLGVRRRCFDTIANIANSPLLNGKTVVIVSHGETTMTMVHGLAYVDKVTHPYYTSFTEAVRFTPEEVAIAEKAVPCENIDDTPVRGAGDGQFLPKRWQRWRVRKGTTACDAPHLTTVMNSYLYQNAKTIL